MERYVIALMPTIDRFVSFPSRSEARYQAFHYELRRFRRRPNSIVDPTGMTDTEKRHDTVRFSGSYHGASGYFECMPQ